MHPFPSSPYQARIEELEEELADTQNALDNLQTDLSYIREVVLSTVLELLMNKKTAYAIRFIQSVLKQ